MHLITKLPSNAAIRDALIKEIKWGQNKQRVMEGIEERRAAEQAKALREQKPIAGEWRCVAHIPRDTYFLLEKKYGRDEVRSKEFLKDWQKRYPHLSPHKL